MEELKKIFENAISTLDAKIKDLSTITVTTITGDVKQIVNSGQIDLANAVTKLCAGNVVGGIELVAQTEVKIDHDAIVYVKKEFTQNDQLCYNLHQSMVDSALKSRNALIELIAKIVTGK